MRVCCHETPALLSSCRARRRAEGRQFGGLLETLSQRLKLAQRTCYRPSSCSGRGVPAENIMGSYSDSAQDPSGLEAIHRWKSRSSYESRFVSRNLPGRIGSPERNECLLFVLAAIFLLAILLARAGRVQGFVHYAPNMLTSMGILGTFVGIVVGLIGFDVNAIDASIGTLLAGLKTAFITSLVGILLAILFKSAETSGLLRRKAVESAVEHVGPEEIHNELRAQREAVEKLSRAIAGDEEATLITQIRLLRSDSRAEANRVREVLEQQRNLQSGLAASTNAQTQRFESFMQELWKKLDDFAEMLSKSATEPVINALKEVIADFNRNLTEQFGENFKELNAAVEKLVLWQENYREQLGQMSEQYAQGVQSITATETSVAHISEESKQIPVAMGELKTVLTTTQH